MCSDHCNCTAFVLSSLFAGPLLANSIGHEGKAPAKRANKQADESSSSLSADIILYDLHLYPAGA